MIDRFETVMHDNFGDKYYWQARRSMRYNKELIGIADKYRQEELGSNDEADGTVMHENWRHDQVNGLISCLFKCNNVAEEARRCCWWRLFSGALATQGFRT